MLYFNLLWEQALPNMSTTSLPGYLKHKKPVCDLCEAGTNCVKCCMCQLRTHGRPRKESESELSQSVSTQPSTQRINPERAARVHKDNIVAVEAPAKEDGRRVSSLQAHILDVLELMGCKEHESSVQRLPHIDARCQVLHAS